MADQAQYLRTGQTGALVSGAAGHVLTMQADGKVKPEAPASGGAPLSNVFFVDKGSASTTEDGSIGAPFKTVQAALDAAALAIGDEVAVLLCPADYTSEGALSFAAPDKLLQLSSLAQSVPGFNGATLPAIGALSCAGSFSGVSLNGINHASVDGGLGSVKLLNCSCFAGTVTCNGGVVSGFNSFFETGVTLEGSAVRLQSCELLGVTLNVSGTSSELTACTLSVSAAVTFTGAAGTLRLDSLSDFYWTDLGVAAVLTNGTVVQLF